MQRAKDSRRVVSRNRRAALEYELEETLEAGLVLLGSEVKSLRGGTANLEDSWISIDEGGHAQLLKAHIPPYAQAGPANHDPLRPRRLLLHRHEARQLRQRLKERGLTLVPVQLYFQGPWIKLECAVARGKKLHDKRATLREKEDRREMDRTLRGR
jgi:SsrA-binding protein